MRDVLRGIRVLEVAQWWLAPSASALLGEWGAEVIKVEHPFTGDAIRGLNTSGAMATASSFNFMLEQCNHGKRSVGLDIGKPEGREVLDRLIEQADVFLTNFLPSARAKLGIDVDDVRAVNPKIIYARAHGAGDKGPERDRGGFDAATFWARGAVAERLTPLSAAHPVTPRPSFGDGITGMSLAGAVAAALFGRERHGEPSVIDVSLLGTAAWVMSPDIVAAGSMGGLPRVGRDAVPNPLSNCYRTSDDRWLWLVMLQSDRHWPEVCEALGRPELISDPRFATADDRGGANRAACMAELEAAFGSRPLAEWEQRLADLEGVWAVVRTPGEVLDDPQVQANGYVAAVDYGGHTERLIPGPSQFDGTPPTLTPAPGVGEHTDEVLAELGLDWDTVVALKVAGVVT